jgi:hypothetical protein
MPPKQIEYDDFLSKNGIILLGIPKINLKPGSIYQSEMDKPAYFDFLGDIGDITATKNNSVGPLQLPSSIDQPIGMDFEGTVKIERNVQVKVSIVKKILGVFKLKGNIDNEKTQLAKCELKSINYLQIKPAELQNILENFVVKKAYQSNYQVLYVVTSTYFCDDLDIQYSQLSNNELKLLAEAEKIAKGSLTIKHGKQSEIRLTCKQTIIFGVNLAKIEYTMPSGNIEKVRPSSFAKPPFMRGLKKKSRQVPIYLTDKEDPKLED